MTTRRVVTWHAAERAATRLGDIRADMRLHAVERATAYAVSHPTDSHAVRVLANLPMRGWPWMAESNGTDVWAVIRNGTVVTMFYRRPTQPATPEALRVTYVSA